MIGRQGSAGPAVAPADLAKSPSLAEVPEMPTAKCQCCRGGAEPDDASSLCSSDYSRPGAAERGAMVEQGHSKKSRLKPTDTGYSLGGYKRKP